MVWGARPPRAQPTTPRRWYLLFGINTRTDGLGSRKKFGARAHRTTAEAAVLPNYTATNSEETLQSDGNLR